MKTLCNNLKNEKMKKLLFLPAATFILASVINAQPSEESIKTDIKTQAREESIIKKEKREEKKELRKLEGKEASYQAKQQFYSDFGDIPGTQWERTLNYDEATFTKDGEILKAYYDDGGKLVGTTAHKTFEEIPSAAQKYINSKYQGYIVKDVILFDDNEFNETDMMLYNRQFEDEDMYFVELEKAGKKIVVDVNPSGVVSFFKEL